MRKIVFRADGGRNIGMGHLVRGMSLAESIAGEDTEFVFVTREIHGMPELLRAKGYAVWAVEAETGPENIAKVVAAIEPSVVINDIRDAPVEYMTLLRDSGFPLISFDDTGDASSLVNVLIDANVSDDTLYLRNGGPKRYYGPRYMLLGGDFARLHEDKRKIREKVKNVMIIMGGSDPGNLTEHVVLSLDMISPDFDVTAIAGYGFSKCEILKEMAERRDWLTVAEQPESLAGLMLDADVAFSSGGISMYELACIGTPSIVLCQCPHEVDNAEIFVQQGIVESLGMGEYVSADEIVNCFNCVANNPGMRSVMNDSGKDFIDGRGIERITRIIDECVMQYSS